MSVRLWSLLVWALVGCSAVYWGLRLWAQPRGLPLQAAVVQPPDLLQTNLARLAAGEGPGVPAPGAAVAAPAPVDGRFVLVGVVSAPPQGGPGPDLAAATPEAPAAALARPAPEGVALIAVDGKSPRAFAVGAVVDGDWVLQAVSRRNAHLGPPGLPVQLQLRIPAPAQPVRGSISPAPP